MKKISLTIISFFFFLAILDGILQTPYVKNKAFAFFMESIQGSSWNVKIDTIESTFPTISLKGVTIESEEFKATFGTLKANLSLLPLLKKEISLSHVDGDTIAWEMKKGKGALRENSGKQLSFTVSVPSFHFTNAAITSDIISNIDGSFSLKPLKKGALLFRFDGDVHPLSENAFLAKKWRLSAKAIQNRDGSWNVEKLKADTEDLNIRGFGNLNADGRIVKSTLQIRSDQLHIEEPFSLKGRLFAHVDLTQNEAGLLATSTWRIPNLEIEKVAIDEAQGKIETQFSNGKISGEAFFNAEFLKHKWEGKTQYFWEENSPLVLKEATLDSPLLNGQGNFEIGRKAVLGGDFSFSTPQLHDLFVRLYGQAVGKILFLGGGQILFDCNAKEVYFDTIYAKEVSIHSDLTNPFSEIEGTVLCDITEGQWKELFLEQLSFATAKEGGNWPFQLQALGKWEHPLDIELDGFWKLSKNDLLISLQNLAGSFFNHPLLLPSPANFEWTPEIFRLTDFSLKIDESAISLFIDRKGDEGEAKLQIKQLPIDFLSLNPLDVAVSGNFDLELSIREKERDLKGELKASVENAEMVVLGQENPLRASGRLDGHFSRDLLEVKGFLNSRSAPLFNFDLSLPIHFEVWPFETKLLYDRAVDGHFFLSGKVEEFLDFLNLGSHRIEGNCLCDLKLFNTLENPHLSGKCDFTEGYYQNYYTGTELQNIEAHFIAKNGILDLISLTAQDSQNKGTFEAKGDIRLLPQEKFPFRFDVSFTRFNCATFDLIMAEASGSLEITGNFEKGIAKGHLEILESDVNIPNRIPRSLPNLQVVYKNAIAPPNIPDMSPHYSYPLHLDLTVDAPDGIFISGRGLESEWKGHFIVQGVLTNVKTQGKIELIKGHLLFSGREFKLTEGALSFSGLENEMPYLNIGASIQVKDILVTAHLKGPLNNPQVTLQSSPPLPMGTILSYLLFGQDLAEINSFQALQLAGSIASLAGEGPGILEQTRKTLGIDRIQIITVPSKTAEGGETIAVQVGKYVTEGVLVSFSQGAENSSSNISIEVDVKGGMSFLLESDQVQEQGKFTFRWARTY